MPVPACQSAPQIETPVPTTSAIEPKHVPSGELRDWRPSAVLLVGLLFRAIYHITYKPWWCGDSGGYARPFVAWIHGYATEGARTPVYPFFLGFCQWLAGAAPAELLSRPAAEVVKDLQSALGLVAACLFYYTLRALRVNKNLALAAGLLFSTTMRICDVEMAILTQSLSVFSLVLGIWLYVRTMVRIGSGESVGKLPMLVGFAIAFAVLLRPDNLVFFAAIVLATAAHAIRSIFIPSRGELGRRLLRTCFLIPIAAAPFILAWMTVNYIDTGRFRITNLMGWNGSETVYNMYGQVNPEDRVLGSIMTRYYVSTNQHGIHREYIWQAMGEINAHAWEMPFLEPAEYNQLKARAQAANVTPQETVRVGTHLSGAFDEYLQRVMWKLVRKNPLGYLHNAADSFLRDSFDFTSSRYLPDEVTDPRAVEGGSVVKSRAGWEVIHRIGMIQAPFLTASYLLTLITVLVCPVVLLGTGGDITTRDVAVSALALGTVATFVAFCLLEAYHNHYGIPHISVLLICTAYAGANFRLVQRRFGH